VFGEQLHEQSTAEFDPIDRLLLHRLHLTEIEGLLVCEALKSVRRGPETAKLLWGDVQEALSEQPQSALSKMEAEALVDRLQRLNDGEAVALLRAVEWFWNRPSLPIAIRLTLIGLN